MAEIGKPIEIWIDSISGVNGSQPHAIDVYIATDDEFFDHFCGGEGICLLRNLNLYTL